MKTDLKPIGARALVGVLTLAVIVSLTGCGGSNAVEEWRPDARISDAPKVNEPKPAAASVDGTYTLDRMKSLIEQSSDSASEDARKAALVSGLLIGAVYPAGAWKFSEEEPDLQDQNLTIATSVQVQIDDLYDSYRGKGISTDQRTCLLAVALEGADDLADKPDRIDVLYRMLEGLDLSTPITKEDMYQLFYEQYSDNVNDRAETKLNLDGTRTVTDDIAACDD